MLAAEKTEAIHREDRPLLLDHRRKLLLRQHRHAERLRLVELAAGLLAGDDVVGLLRHAAGRLAAERFDQLLDLLAAVVRQRAGHDERLAGEAGVAGRRGSLCPRSASRRGRAVPRSSSRRRSSGRSRGCSRPAAGRCRRPARAVRRWPPGGRRWSRTPGRAGRPRVADVPDAEPGEQPRQAALLARLDAVEQVLRRLLAHPLQLDKLVQRQAVEVRDATSPGRYRRAGR